METEYRTFAGAILTILSIFGVIVYAGMKLDILFNFDDYKVQKRVSQYFYAEDEPFTADQDFMVAAIMIDGATDQHVEIPANIGSLKFYRKQWADNVPLSFEKIE